MAATISRGHIAMSQYARRSRSANRRARAAGLLRQGVLYFILLAIAVVWIYPFLWVISTSLKTNAEIFASNSLIPKLVDWSNYPRAWTVGHFNEYFFNTVVVSACAVAAVVGLSATAGYALSRRRLVGRGLIVALLISTLLVPQSFTIIPVFDLIRRIGLLNTIWGVVVGQIGGAQVLYILLFMGFFLQLPKELEESAKIDGGGFVRIFWFIMLPMTRPVVATVVIFQFLASWNDFLLPLVFTLGNPSARTLGVGMYAFVGDHQIDWAGMTAAGTISLVPIMIVFILMQKHFVRGLAGAIKE